MIFAILFVITFLIGAGAYHFTSRWWVGVVITSVIFVADVLLDQAAREYWLISLIFGLPIVFAASLLGAYVVERQRHTHEDESPEEPPST